MIQTEIGKPIDGWGKFEGDKPEKDALHVAVAPVVAAHDLQRGDAIGFIVEGDCEKVGKVDNPIGIVDPFLEEIFVYRGMRFWMFLYPNTITTLKHVWKHPAFEEKPNEMGASEKWLREYAAEVGVSYEETMEHAQQSLQDNEYYHTLSYDTPDIVFSQAENFWKHFEKQTGVLVADKKKTFFSCSC